MSNYESMEREVNMWKRLDAENIFCVIVYDNLSPECLDWFIESDFYDICMRASVKVINNEKEKMCGLSIEDVYKKIMIQEEVIREIIMTRYNEEHPVSLDDIYKELPETVKRLFVSTDCTLTEVEDIEDAPTASGVFMHSDVVHYYAIEIKRNTSFKKENVVYHEFGHLLDYGYDESFKSQSDIFVEIYNTEKDHFVVDCNYEYATSTPREYFAEAFAEYMTNPDRLRDNTPMTYDYIEHVLRITDLEEVIYAKQISRNRRLRKVCDDIMDAGENPSAWRRFKLVVRYNWHNEETLRGKLKSIAKIIFGR